MSAAKGLADMSDDDGVASSADAAADDEDWSSDCEHAMCRRACPLPMPHGRKATRTRAPPPTPRSCAPIPADSPPDGRYSSAWPEDWSKEQIAKEASEIVTHYVEDWGWELHKYARLNSAKRVRKVLRYQIHLETFDGYGTSKEVLNWRDDDFGQTPLWWVSMHGNASLAQDLVNAGADVNTADNDGWTPLSVAAFYGHAEIIKSLLASGADPSKTVEDGDTAYDKAIAWDHPDCAALLKGASPAPPVAIASSLRAPTLCARMMAEHAVALSPPQACDGLHK